jgi:hypothetical protein
VVQWGKKLQNDGHCNEMPGKRHTRYRNPAMCDEALHQITPAMENELLHRTKKEKSMKKRKKAA